MEAEIRGLMNVINDQHRYILELHNTQSLQLQQIPNTHLGPKNLYRGGWGRGPPAFDGGGLYAGVLRRFLTFLGGLK